MEVKKLLLVISLTVGVINAAVMTPSLSAHFITHERAEIVMLEMKDKVSEVISTINSRSFKDADEKTLELRHQLHKFTSKSQANVLSYLRRRADEHEMVVKGFYITNRISIRNAHRNVIADLMKIHANDIELIREAVRIEPSLPIVHDDDEGVNMIGKANVIPWGIGKIGAGKAHSMGYTGQNIVVATMDSGVRKSHEALKDKIRSSYNWYDAQNHTSEPIDKVGHGTHCTGTILGGNRIGVSPSSKWIACRIFDEADASEDVILVCAQWIFCPTLWDGTKEDCTKRPHVCSNSWGGGQNGHFFNDAVSVWQAANIIPVFSIGNSGPLCGTANSPGDQDNLISVGAVTARDTLADFSSRGPTVNTFHPKLKPDVSAPGFRIISSVNGGDDQYKSYSGTSMAAPHTSGAIAVMLSKKPTATFSEIFNALKASALHPQLTSNIFHQCYYEGVANATVAWPNNLYGSGIIQLDAALALLN